MRVPPLVPAVWIAALSLLCGPIPTSAQSIAYRVGLAPRVGVLFGNSDILDGGLGLEATGGMRLGDSPVWIRADVGFVGLDATTPTPGGGTSDNTLFTFVAGPRSRDISAPSGRFSTCWRATR